MRSIEEVRRVLALVEEGFNDCEVSRETGIPRATVRTWRAGGIPHIARSAHEGSCRVCGHPAHDHEDLSTPEYAYLLGLYLGDGTITTHRRGVHRLGITLDRKYPGIVQECASAMAAVMPSSKVGIQHYGHMNADFVNSYSRAWPCLLPQHGAGRKHLRLIELTTWQWEIVEIDPRPLLRGLIHSDGCRHLNTIRHPKKTYRYSRYEFANESEDIKRIFCCALDLIDIEWRVMNAKTISIARRDSVAKLDEFIGPKR
jgi:hypothetical protein